MIRIHTRDGSTHETTGLTLADAIGVFGVSGGVIAVSASTRDPDGNGGDVRDVVIPAHAVDFIEDVTR